VQPDIPDNCRKAPACIDYQSYVFTLPQDLAVLASKKLTERLVGLGKLRHEMLGTTYVDTKWGLLVVPPAGFPEMKVNFFHHITKKQIVRVLSDITELLRSTE
jgi:hypothetical protein